MRDLNREMIRSESCDVVCSFRREKVTYCLCEPEKDLVIIVFEKKFLPEAEKRVAKLVFIA